MALIDALQEWEGRWRAAGVPDGILLPGVSEAEVRAAIDFAPVHPDAVTWFGWQNGPATHFTAPPSDREPLGVSHALINREVLAMLESGREGGGEFKPSWLPLLGEAALECIYMDLETGAIYRRDVGLWSGDSFGVNLRVADDLESLIRIYLDVWRIVQPVWVPGDEAFEVDRSLMPDDLFQRHIIG